MYKILAIYRLLFCDKFHLVTYSKNHLHHMNSSFNQIEVDYDWLDEGCEKINHIQQEDANIDYIKNNLTRIK